MPLTSTESGLKTPLDYMAEGYWQDFLARRPIAGGIVYEVAVHACVLDESLASLQRIDTLLSQIRRDLIKAKTWDEQVLLSNSRYRNLLVFLAFYVGKVLAKQWQSPPHWYSPLELRELTPSLQLQGDDFYQQMAVFYTGLEANVSNATASPSLSVFFALEPIGMRLFGHLDRPFFAANGAKVANGVYQAVIELLPKNAAEPLGGAVPVNLVPTLKKVPPSNRSNVNSGNPSFINAHSPNSSPQAVAKSVQAAVSPSASLKQKSEPVTPITVKPIPLKSKVIAPEAITPETVIPNMVTPKPVPKSPVKPVPPTPEIFTQLLADLENIDHESSVGDSENDYQKACKVLDQFERHIAKQNKPRSQVEFSNAHQKARHQALLLLERAATEGHTGAMLRLAMVELLAEGLISDKQPNQIEKSQEAGVEWVKQAAQKDDSRAQRFLSKLYYQGLGVTQDLNQGKYWVEQAANHGHPEAVTLIAQWQQAEALISTRQSETQSVKRYQLLIAAIIIGALLLVILV